ncbi:DMT family transporter, partial [Variovorax sp. KK3]|uniref:DMT family transporter n=1 Tax=Variovorax sp. KK3 TaxID=1855728 RepID=UPI00097C0431
ARPALTARDWMGVFGLGFSGYYLSSFLDFAGLAYVTANLERLILYLNPTLVLLFGWIAFRRRITRGQMFGMAISYSGVMVVFGHELGLGQSTSAAWGTLLIFLSAVSYSIYLVASGEFVKRLGSLRLVGLATSVACVLCIVQFLLLRPVEVALQVAPAVIWLSVLNATACTALPVLAVMMAVERVGPAMTAQTGMIGPLSTIVLSALILGEPFTVWIAAGTALVIAGIFVFTRLGR